MSIARIINALGMNRRLIADLYGYTTDDVKTLNKRLIGAIGCSVNHAIEEMKMIKRLNHKTGGRQCIHLVVSLTPDDSKNAHSVYMQIAKEIAGWFGKYQSFYAVHLDTKVRHIHIVLNSVSFHDGKKFTQSPSDLSRLKQHCNKVLSKHGFDIIKTGSADFLDTSDYSDAVGFNHLEIEEPIQIDNEIAKMNEINLNDDPIPIPTQGAIWQDLSNPSDPYLNPDYPYYHDGGFSMTTNNDYTGQQRLLPPTPATPPNLAVIENELPPDYYEQSALPTLTVSSGAQYTVHVKPDADPHEVIEYAQQLGTVSEAQMNTAVNYSWALFKRAQSEGSLINIHMDIAPHIDIDFTGMQSVMQSDDVVDITMDVTPIE